MFKRKFRSMGLQSNPIGLCDIYQKACQILLLIFRYRHRKK